MALDKVDPTNKSSLSISGKTFAGKPVFLLKENQIVQQTKGDSQGKFYFSLNDLEVWHYKIKWVGPELEDSPCWVEGGYPIWGEFEVIMDHGTADGEHMWFTHAIPSGYKAVVEE